MKAYFLSNGYGEDFIGNRLAQALNTINPNITCVAAPLLGEGKAYSCKTLIKSPMPPSGGFLRSPLAILKDLFSLSPLWLFKHIISLRNTKKKQRL